MSYEVSIGRSAGKEMNRLLTTVQARLSKRILSMGDNLHPRGVRKLGGREVYG